jgi:UTP--glucose-1-phosphate uridylyltransferase
MFSVDKFLEKPNVEDTDSRHAVIGKYILTPEVFDYLAKVTPSKKDGEIRLADAFELMRQSKDIYGLKVKGTRYDTGDKL